MSPDELKLPQVDPSSFLTATRFQKEWVIDPPPFVARFLTEDRAKIIYKAKVEGLSQIAHLEGQMKEIEAKMFEKINKALG